MTSRTPADHKPADRFEHERHPHQPRNPNSVLNSTPPSLNEKVAVFLTAYVGTMWTAYGFCALSLCGLLGIVGILHPDIYTFISWLSQTFIQLVLLPVIMVGQNVLNKRSEIQADEQFKITQKSFHEIDQIVKHLYHQDEELLKQTEMLARLLQRRRRRVSEAGE